MPPFSFADVFAIPGWPSRPVPSAAAPALLAFGAALAAGLAGRATGARWLAAACGAVGALAGWMALLPGAASPRAMLTPRTLAEVLLLPAAAATLAAVVSPRLRGPAERWLPSALAVLMGWWLARSAPARPEFWRAWFAAVLAWWLLARLVGASGAGGRVLAAALALAGALWLAGVPPVWTAAALAAAGAAGGACVGGGALPPVLLAAVSVAADLGAGRLLAGRVNAADLACLLSPGAAWLVPRAAARLGRAGRVLAVPAAAALAAGAAWLGGRVLLHR